MKRYAFAAASILLGMSTHALAQGAPGQVVIESVNHTGPGCMDGTVTTAISADRQAMTMLFDSFVVDSSEYPQPVIRKLCTVQVRLRTPEKWAFSIHGVTTRGYVNMEPGVTGFIESEYAFAGARRAVINPLRFAGPVAQDYTLTTPMAVAQMAWSPCGQVHNVQIKTTGEVRTIPATKTIPVRLMSRGSKPSEMAFPVEVRGVALIRNLSPAQCRQNIDFGFTLNKVWVRNGCSAELAVTMDAVGEAKPLGGGLLTVDSIDGEFRQDFGIMWARCSG